MTFSVDSLHKFFKKSLISGKWKTVSGKLQFQNIEFYLKLETQNNELTTYRLAFTTAQPSVLEFSQSLIFKIRSKK